MSNISEERLALAQAVVQPMPSHNSIRRRQTRETRVNRTIEYLEKHNEEVRSRIHLTALAAQASHAHTPSPPPTTSTTKTPTDTPNPTHGIITALSKSHNPKSPTPSYNPPPPHHHLPPPPPLHPDHHLPSNTKTTAASIARDTVERLEVFEEQAQKTLAGYYVERERVREAQRVERMGRAVRVPEGFGVEWVGAGAGAGAGGVGAGVEGMGGGEGGKGRVDSSRDPRLRRE